MSRQGEESASKTPIRFASVDGRHLKDVMLPLCCLTSFGGEVIKLIPKMLFRVYAYPAIYQKQSFNVQVLHCRRQYSRRRI